MSYQGDYVLAATVVFDFSTKSFGTPTTLSGTPAISVYKNSLTESTTGVTLTVDYDGRTGLNHVVIDTSADGTFYATATDFSVVVTTGTIAGVSAVGSVVGSFSINNRSALRPATAGRTLAVDASGRALGDVDTIKTNPVANGGTVTFPTNATLASTINITAGTITTATNVTTVNGLAANVITAAATAADFGAEIATAIWTDTVAGDFTAANSIGKSIMNGIALGTGLTIVSVSGSVGGNVVGSVGSVVGLTASDVGAIKTKTDFLPSATAGAAGGVVIAGSNAATTFATLTSTGALSINGVSNVAQTGDNYALANGASGFVAIKGDTAQIKGDLPTVITKNTALANFPFFMVKSSDHATGQVGLTITATRSLDGAAFAACANSVSEIGGGWYKITLAATDTNANTIAFNFDGGATADVLAFTVATQPD